MKRFLLPAAMILVSLGVSLAIGEAACRILYLRLADYDLEMWRYFAALKEMLPYEKLPFAHYPNRKGVYYGVEIATNAEGFRDYEYPKERVPGKTRMIMLGDSFVMGWGVPFEDTMAKRLERALNRDGDRYEVINMGVGNYNSTMEVELFKRRGLAFQPDLVILVYFVNDVEPIPRLSWPGYYVRKNSYLLAVCWDRFVKFRARFDTGFNWKDYYASLYDPRSPTVATNRESIKELAAACRERGIHLIVFGYPDLHQLKDYPLPMATDYIRGRASECGIPFVDLLPYFAPHDPKLLWVSMEDTHGNAEACRIAADAMVEGLVRNGLATAN